MRYFQNIITRFNIIKLHKIAHCNLVFWAIFLIFGACLCAYLRFDFLWDFVNYHYYNAWKFWEHPDNLTIYSLPGGMNTLLNPLLDVPLYLLIKYFNDLPHLIYAVQGLWFGTLIFLFWKICFLFFNKDNIKNLFAIIISTIIAVTGHSVWFQAGSSTNEIQVAVPVMSVLYFLFKYVKYQLLQKWWKFILLGLVMGTALGLKQTCLSYAFASGFAMLICYRYFNYPKLYIFLYALGGLIGFLIVHGYFMYQLYLAYGNPFLPALSNILSPEWFGYRTLIDTKFIPKGLSVFYYPYIMEDKAAEIHVSEKRYIVFYTLFILFFLKSLYDKWHHRRIAFFTDRLNCFAIIFLIISYVIWIKIFGILRYFVIIEMLSAIFAVKIILFLLPKKDRLNPYYWSSFIILMYALIATPFYSFPWPNVHKQDSKKFLRVEPLYIPDNVLVVLNAQPSALFLKSLSENNKHVTVILDRIAGSEPVRYIPANLIYQQRDKIRKQYGKNVVFIHPKNSLDLFDGDKLDSQRIELAKMNKNMKCRLIDSNLDNEFRICYSNVLKNIPIFEEKQVNEQPHPNLAN